MNDKDTPTPRTDALRKLIEFKLADLPQSALSVALLTCEDLERENAELRQQLAALERGEYICNKSGLRKDSEHEKGDF